MNPHEGKYLRNENIKSPADNARSIITIIPSILTALRIYNPAIRNSKVEIVFIIFGFFSVGVTGVSVSCVKI